jgi:hypothetical protein
MRPSDERIIFGSTQKFRRDTGWRPQRSIEQTLTSMLEFWGRVPDHTGNSTENIQKLRWAGLGRPSKLGA